MMLSWTSFSMCMSSCSRTFRSSSSSLYCFDSSRFCCFNASSRCLAAAFSAERCACACCAWLSWSARVAASASRPLICRRSCDSDSRCSFSILSAWTSASLCASSNCLFRSAISCCSSASRPRQVSRSLRRASASSARAAVRRASSARWTSASALLLCSSPSTAESFCHCNSLCCRRLLRSSSKPLRSFFSSSCLSCSIFARSSAEARRTRRSEASSSAARCAYTACWTSACSLSTRASCSSAWRWWWELSRWETCCSTDFLKLSRSIIDCLRILSSSLVMVVAISSFISSIFWN
mmetsp:Transcript_73948/g.228502  ORF Transcript_73948/g.228502 Transcript_73948/m.228502 type:complete len:295 (-) Transcript_73948:1298-2182(-)